MTIRTLTLSSILAAACLAGSAQGQILRISSSDKYAWGENIGWLNFANGGNPSGAESLSMFPTHLSGYVWGENVGWIHLGNGNGPYANTNNTNYGVNYNRTTGNLSGYAWGENIGWINFAGGGLATPANPARIDEVARRFRGYAWGENVGWINLDDAGKFVGINCLADIDGSGEVDLLDFFAFFNCWDVAGPCQDLDGVPGVDLLDFFAFFNAWDSAC